MITIKVFQTGNIHEALETLGDQAGLNVIRYWKKKMQKKGGCFNEQDFSSLFLCQRRYCQSGG